MALKPTESVYQVVHIPLRVEIERLLKILNINSIKFAEKDYRSNEIKVIFLIRNLEDNEIFIFLLKKLLFCI